MSASWPPTMRGPRGKTPPLVFPLLLWLLAGTWTGAVWCQDGGDDQESETPADETEVVEEVVDGDTDVLAEPTLSSPDAPPTLDPSPTQEGGTDTERIATEDRAEDLGSGGDSPEASTEDMNYADSTLSPLGDEGFSLPMVVIPVALVVFIVAAVVLAVFLKRRLSKEAAKDSRKDDPYLDGSSVEKVPMPMFEEDVPSVLELEMDELDQWMKNDG
uniref:transmembrane protein 154 n=1 Tax=Doryrhamphus excisus TaxID=161450 RepID=UPI0025AE93EA|nr:transmembrane protein 154 [Doryrhamphus excisus]